MAKHPLLRYALFFGLGYTLSVLLIRWSGVDHVISRGRWVQHLSAEIMGRDSDPTGHTFPQLAQRGGKNHDTVKQAFFDVTHQVRFATVSLLHNDKPVSLGTVVRSEGWIISKASELPTADLDCVLANGEHYRAERVAVDQQHDLALLRVHGATNLTEVPWNDKAPGVGSLLASSSPSAAPMAIGIVSVPLIDIPRNPGMLGIRMRQGKSGPVVSQSLPGGAAESAGLLAEDAIVAVNDVRVHTTRQLSETIRNQWPGDVVRLTIARGDQELSVPVQLIREDDLDLENRDFQYELGGPLSMRRSGFGSVIQHDTVLTPEQCGGPLVDLNGQVVGINIARAERIATYALPASVVQESVARLLPHDSPRIATQPAARVVTP